MVRSENQEKQNLNNKLKLLKYERHIEALRTPS